MTSVIRTLYSRWFESGLRLLVFLAALVPFLSLVQAVIFNTLGPDPADTLMHETGKWALILLCIVLLARPLAYYGWPRLFSYRRQLGLFVMFYASVHLLVFAQVYIGWSVELLTEELVERPYVLVGAIAWGLLLPLTVTSTRKWRRRLGRRWRRLHQLIYPVVLLAWCHVFWLSRSDLGDAVSYGLVIMLLLLWRIRGAVIKVLRIRTASC